MEGQLGVLGEQGVDVRGLTLAAVAPHRQHVAHDAVGAVAVMADAAEILGQVLLHLVHHPALFVGQRLAHLLQHLVELFEQLLGGFREVLHEVERILDLVRHPRRQLAQGGEFFLRHHLILGALQFGQRPLQLLVLAAQFLGELLHEVEALHFQRVAPEHFQRPGHVRHLVAPLDLHCRFEVAVRHRRHAVRQLLDAPQQHLADEQPGDEHGAEDAQHVERQQQRAPGADRPGRCLGGGQGLLAGGADQPFHFLHKLGGELAVVGQQVALPGFQRQFLRSQGKAAVCGKAEVAQPGEHRRQSVRRRAVGQCREAPFRRADRGLEAVAQRFEQRRVGEVEGAAQHLRADRRIGEEAGQVPIARDFGFRKMLGARCRRRAKLPIAGDRVEQLIVDGRHQNVVELGLHGAEFRAHRSAAGRKREALRNGRLDGVDVGGQGGAAFADAAVPLVFAHERGKLALERLALGFDACRGGFERLRRLGSHDARRRRHQHPGALRDAERRGHLRHPFVDAPLGVAHLVEGEPADQAGGHGEGGGRADASVELGGDARSARRDAL